MVINEDDHHFGSTSHDDHDDNLNNTYHSNNEFHYSSSIREGRDRTEDSEDLIPKPKMTRNSALSYKMNLIIDERQWGATFSKIISLLISLLLIASLGLYLAVCPLAQSFYLEIRDLDTSSVILFAKIV